MTQDEFDILGTDVTSLHDFGHRALYCRDFVSVGYRLYYHADIAATFELAQRPDGTGECLKQVVAQPSQSWAPEPTGPYTIVGDGSWKDYEVSVDAAIETTGWASLIGRVNNVGTGYGTGLEAYFLTLDSSGSWGFNLGSGANSANTAEASTSLANGKATLKAGSWHNMKLVFSGSSIKGLIDGTQVFSVTNGTYQSGQVGLGTQSQGGKYKIADFDNLIVTPVNAAAPSPTKFVQDTQNGGAGGTAGSGGSAGTGGTPGTGGASATGGMVGIGGSAGARASTGGALDTGGSVATGGASGASTGGASGTATGGASGVPTGGASGTVTSGAAAGVGTDQSGSDSGCSCRVAGPGAPPEGASLR